MFLPSCYVKGFYTNDVKYAYKEPFAANNFSFWSIVMHVVAILIKIRLDASEKLQKDRQVWEFVYVIVCTANNGTSNNIILEQLQR